MNDMVVGVPEKPHINAVALEWVGKARAWLDRAKAAKPIETVEEHEQALAARKMLGQAKRQIEDMRKQHGAPYRAAIEAVNAFFNGPGEHVEEAIKIQDKRIQTFEKTEAERRRVAEEQARRAREAEARRLREEAERMERERQEAEAAALAQAQALEAEGRVDEADELLAEAAAESQSSVVVEQAVMAAAEITASAPMVAAPALASGGLRRTTHYSARVVDLPKLVEAWQAGTVPPECIVVNDKFLNAMARAQKEGFRYPGCELVTDSRIGG